MNCRTSFSLVRPLKAGWGCWGWIRCQPCQVQPGHAPTLERALVGQTSLTSSSLPTVTKVQADDYVTGFILVRPLKAGWGCWGCWGWIRCQPCQVQPGHAPTLERALVGQTSLTSSSLPTVTKVQADDYVTGFILVRPLKAGWGCWGWIRGRPCQATHRHLREPWWDKHH